MHVYLDVWAHPANSDYGLTRRAFLVNTFEEDRPTLIENEDVRINFDLPLPKGRDIRRPIDIEIRLRGRGAIGPGPVLALTGPVGSVSARADVVVTAIMLTPA